MTIDYIQHSGVLGMKCGIRRYQNEDGPLTALGKSHYAKDTNYSGKQRKDLRATQDSMKKTRAKNAAITIAGSTALAGALAATGAIGVATFVAVSSASVVTATTNAIKETKQINEFKQRIENGNSAINYAVNHANYTLDDARSNAYYKAKYAGWT